MNYFIHYFIKISLNFFLHIFWVFPLKKNRVFLINDLGFTYGDSLKSICEYLNAEAPKEFEIIFPLKTACNNLDVKTVKPFTLEYFYYLLTSGFVITNSGGISYVPIRKRQLTISTWHGGGPYKKTGSDIFNNKWTVKEAKLHAKKLNYMLSSCFYFTKYECKSMFVDEKKCIACGMPRNDVFFSDNVEIKKKVHDFFNLPQNVKFVLYAPTYRSDMGNYAFGLYKETKSTLDYAAVIKSLQEAMGGEWFFAVRLHPRLADTTIEGDHILNFKNYPDMQELLYAADAVITDYSSLMWDYSFTFKPCFLFAEDIEQYEQERGFYMPPSKWPFPIAHNNNEMVRNILHFDSDAYKTAVSKHHEESGSYEQGIACATVLKLLRGKNESIN